MGRCVGIDRQNLAVIETKIECRNVFGTLEATEASIPPKTCIIGLGFDGIALAVRNTIQELLQGGSQKRE